MNPVRIVIQGGSRLLREGLAAFFDDQADLEVVGSVATPGQLAWLCGSRPVDVAVVHVPHAGADVEGFAEVLRARSPSTRLVGVHDGVARADAARLRNAGFAAFVHRRRGARALLDAVRRPPAADALVDDGMPSRPAAPSLTAREVRVLELVAAGATGAEIGEQLGVSVRTAENVKRRLFDKLGVTTRTQAVAAAAARGLLPPAPASVSGVASVVAAQSAARAPRARA